MIVTKYHIFFFIPILISFISIQLVYAQTVENEIIENTLETVEKAATEGLAEITESVSNASKSIAKSTENAKESSNNNASSQAFQQIENIATDMGNASENAIAGAREQIEETVSGAKSAVANAREGTENATEGTREQIEESISGAQSIATNITNATENSEQSTTLKTPVYENLTRSISSPQMGIKIKYPSIGHVDAIRVNSCHELMCYIEIILNSSSNRKITIESTPPTWYTKPNEESMVYDKHLKTFIDKTPIYTNDTLLDFTKDKYLDLIHPSFKYLNDSLTTVSNSTAIQMEYIDYGRHTLEIFTTNDGIFYSIIYQEKSSGDIHENKKIFNDNLKDVMKIINSIEFYKEEYKSKIPDDIELFSISKKRDFPTFINITDLSNQTIRQIIDTLNFRERYSEFVFDNSTIGIKFKYPPKNWIVHSESGIKDCYKQRCGSLMERINGGITLIGFRSIPPNDYLENCNCTNIHDYIKSIYDETFGDQSDFDYEFVNDNLTLIDNHTAIQLEFIGKKGSDSENNHVSHLYVQVGDIFYNFDYVIDDEVYRIFLPEVKKIIDSIQFIEMDKPKRPSFM